MLISKVLSHVAARSKDRGGGWQEVAKKGFKFSLVGEILLYKSFSPTKISYESSENSKDHAKFLPELTTCNACCALHTSHDLAAHPVPTAETSANSPSCLSAETVMHAGTVTTGSPRL